MLNPRFRTACLGFVLGNLVATLFAAGPIAIIGLIAITPLLYEDFVKTINAD